MPKLTPISGKKLIKLLGLRGFTVIRIKGSHCFLRNNKTNGMTSIPVHGKEEMGTGLLISILSDIGLSRKEYENLRKKV